MTGRDTLKERSTKPVKIAESDIDVSIKKHFSKPYADFSVVQLHGHYYAPWAEMLQVATFLLGF